MKLGGLASTPEGRDLDILKNILATDNKMKFNKTHYVDCYKPNTQIQKEGHNWLGSGTGNKELGYIVNHNLKLSH